ncbi:MAG: hypothetical protein PHF30_03775 [Bacilli bacterium]|nr:hypothetical protein [Bacilli bacterium]
MTRMYWKNTKKFFVNEYRHDFDVKEVYASRSQHIERMFATANKNMDYDTPYLKVKEKSNLKSGLFLHARI